MNLTAMLHLVYCHVCTSFVRVVSTNYLTLQLNCLMVRRTFAVLFVNKLPMWVVCSLSGRATWFIQVWLRSLWLAENYSIEIVRIVQLAKNNLSCIEYFKPYSGTILMVILFVGETERSVFITLRLCIDELIRNWSYKLFFVIMY